MKKKKKLQVLKKKVGEGKYVKSILVCETLTLLPNNMKDPDT